MKRTLLIFPVIVVAFAFQSCSSVYKCGDPVPDKISGSKRLKEVVSERNTLCSELASEREKNQKLNRENSNLRAEVNEKVSELIKQQASYDGLLAEKTLGEARYNSDMKQKANELLAKESQLVEREKTLKELQDIITRQEDAANKLNESLRGALLGFNSDELSVEVINGKVYVSMSDKLLFKSGSAAVEEKGKDALRALADVLLKNIDINVLIEGHTDNVPIKTAVYNDNWDLSVARATSIVRILTESYYVDPIRVTASGRGEYSPKATNDTSEGRAKNRRTEIILTPRLDEVMELLNK